ncbi:Histidine phosphatase superfamily, clade-1 [Artemisia annua]|uniref:Histidine phosphatase superfamily, clade-1 n=1 Tax=Artemisia annua TaxID=35608 RepID=A0A2U1MEX2_ARTAN|nr:Histidine phosphatase superfamily, clade-1 [Artemisia annua]
MYPLFPQNPNDLLLYLDSCLVIPPPNGKKPKGLMNMIRYVPLTISSRICLYLVYHPIHDQTFYLTVEHNNKLKEEYACTRHSRVVEDTSNTALPDISGSQRNSEYACVLLKGTLTASSTFVSSCFPDLHKRTLQMWEKGIQVIRFRPLIGPGNFPFTFEPKFLVIHGCIGTIKSHGYINNYALHQEVGDSSLRLTSNGFKIDLGVSRNDCCRERGAVVIQASSFQTTTIVLDQVSTPLNTKIDSPKKTSMVSPLVNRPFVIFILGQIITSILSKGRIGCWCLKWSENCSYEYDHTLVNRQSMDVLWYQGVAAGQLCQILSGHTGPIESVAFNPAEVLMAVGASSGVVKLWDLEETKASHCIPWKSITDIIRPRYLFFLKTLMIVYASYDDYDDPLGSLKVVLTDPGALDYFDCKEQLTTPIFQFSFYCL